MWGIFFHKACSLPDAPPPLEAEENLVEMGTCVSAAARLVFFFFFYVFFVYLDVPKKSTKKTKFVGFLGIFQMML